MPYHSESCLTLILLHHAAANKANQTSPYFNGRAQEQQDDGPQQGQRGLDERLVSSREAGRVPPAAMAATPESRPRTETLRKSVHERSALSHMTCHTCSLGCMLAYPRKLIGKEFLRW